MAQDVFGVNNHKTTTLQRNSIEDYSAVFRHLIHNEGIIEGLVVSPTDPVSPDILISPGYVAIDCGGDEMLVFRLKTELQLTVPNTGTEKYYNVVFHVSLENATAEFEVLEGDASNDPTLTEGAANLDYYVVVAQIDADANSDISQSEIVQDGDTLTNPATGTPEIIARLANHDGWNPVLDTMTYASTTSVTVEGDKTIKYKQGVKIKFDNDSTVKYNQISADSTYNSGTGLTTIVFGAAFDGVVNSAITNPYYSTAQNPLGMADGAEAQTAYIVLGAGSGMPSTTSGAAIPVQVEFGTNDVDMYLMDFDQSTDEYAQWGLVMPDNWDGGTVTARFYWTAASGTPAQNVIWGIQGLCLGNDDAIDQAFGTAVLVTDALIATGDMHISSATAAITIANAAAGEMCIFRVYRDADDGGDTLAADARLAMVKIEYSLL